MKIGIDIDDVITDTSLAINDYILKYDKTNKFAPYMVEIMRGEIPEIAKEFIDKNLLSIYASLSIKSNAIQIINKLFDDNNEIIIITSRGEVKFKGSEEFTLKFLKNNNINYNKIIFNSFEKPKICIENNIDLLIDDSVKFCEEFSQLGGNSIVFTSQVNKDIKTNVERVNNWLELADKINTLKRI